MITTKILIVVVIINCKNNIKFEVEREKKIELSSDSNIQCF